jgi:glycosyltransferase involved in cell wall biosynthesis
MVGEAGPILWIAPEFLPRLGGIERLTHAVTDALARRRPVVLATRPGQGPPAGSPVRSVAVLPPQGRPEPPEETTSRLLALARDLAPAVIHLASAGPAIHAAALSAVAPVVATVHCNDLTAPWYPHPAAASTEAIARALSGLDRVLCVSPFTAAAVRERAPEARIEVLTPGLEPPAEPLGDRVRALWTRPVRAEPVVLTVARIAPRKGHRALLAALERLGPGRPFRWWVVGTGPEEVAFAAALAASPVAARTRRFGAVPDGRLAGLREAADLFALAPEASRADGRLDAEGFGLVYLEAALAGLPSVASRSGGIEAAVVDGETGLLAEPGDAASLAQALDRLLADADLRRRMGLSALDRARAAFALAPRLDRLETLYATLTRPPPARWRPRAPAGPEGRAG